ncbi:hypothetical protein Y032_0066g3739 [Ancylostoma ceylanicum]|uniref:G-protein coupled receptors family 1 profile domain-containing protein n=1 Tax=Ancylostoma ceylanicum TaxID=53326 RepID=A0A016U047_9BILA|nr:hypothetical protein Y032_0066g3739 [Ancylostoma ceylanicum]
MLTDSTYSITIGGICGVAVCSNIILLFALVKVQAKAARSCRGFFLLTTLHCWLSAICCGITIPRVFTFDFVFVFVAVGPLYGEKFSSWFLILWRSILMSSFLLVINKFIYRYILVCRPHIAHVYTSRKWQTIMVVTNIVLLLKWMALTSYGFYPTQEFERIVRSGMLQHFDLDVASTPFIGCSSHNTAATAVVVECLLTIFVLASIGVYCAACTYISIKGNIASLPMKRLHRQMFILLIVESVYTILSLQAPISAVRLLLFTGITSTTTFSYAIGIVLSSFNCFCPAIAILFMRDYRNFLMKMFGLKKP